LKKEQFRELDNIFHPQKVAIIGASPVADIATVALMNTRMRDHVYFVNPKYKEIFGRKCYASVLDIEGPVDYAIIGINASYVPGVITECIAKGITGAHIYTSGFSETGLIEGIELESKLKAAAGGKIRIIGPNCFGIYCPLRAAIVPNREEEGNGGDSQSGSVAESFSFRKLSPSSARS
jgi:acetyltransferase